MRSEVTLVTNDPNAIVISGVYDEFGAVYLARAVLKRLAGIEDPPPPPVDTEPVVTDEPTPEPVNVEPPKPKTKAEIRAEQAAQRQADREWKRWLAQRERENVEVR
jgi:outer membrane biosynthesis protein TonB